MFRVSVDKDQLIDWLIKDDNYCGWSLHHGGLIMKSENGNVYTLAVILMCPIE